MASTNATTLPVNWERDLRASAAAHIAAADGSKKTDLTQDKWSLDEIIRNIKAKECADAYKFLSYVEEDNYPLLYLLEADIHVLLDIVCRDYVPTNSNNNTNGRSVNSAVSGPEMRRTAAITESLRASGAYNGGYRRSKRGTRRGSSRRVRRSRRSRR